MPPIIRLLNFSQMGKLVLWCATSTSKKGKLFGRSLFSSRGDKTFNANLKLKAGGSIKASVHCSWSRFIPTHTRTYPVQLPVVETRVKKFCLSFHLIVVNKTFVWHHFDFPYIDSLQIISHIFPPSKWLAMLKLIAEWTELFPEVPSGGFLHLRPMQPNVKINLHQFRPEAETVLYVFFTEKFSFWDLESAELWWMWTICVEPMSKYKCSCLFSLSQLVSNPTNSN